MTRASSPSQSFILLCEVMITITKHQVSQYYLVLVYEKNIEGAKQRVLAAAASGAEAAVGIQCIQSICIQYTVLTVTADSANGNR